MPGKLTPAEKAEQEDRLLAEQAALVDDMLDDHMTLDADMDDEDAARAEALTAHLLDAETAITRKEFRALEDRLIEQSSISERLAKKLGTSDEYAAQLSEEQADKNRRAIYAQIKSRGGKVKIQVQANEAEGGTRPVQVSINGHKYPLPRGVPIEVDVSVMEVLDNARVRSWRPEVTPTGEKILVPYNYLRFPYTRLDGPIGG